MARKRVSENPLVVSTGAAAVPARRKSTTATTKRATRTTAKTVNVTEAAPEVETPVAVTAPAVNNEQIAQLAYSFWAARGYQGGSPEEDWLRAEQQLSALSAK